MNRLKELRNAHGLSQAAFAKKIGVAQNTVSNWENGNRLIDTDTVTKIADMFGTTTDYLLGRAYDKNQKSGEENIPFDDFTYTMHIETRDLPNDDKQMLIDMARMMKKRVEKKEPTLADYAKIAAEGGKTTKFNVDNDDANPTPFKKS